MSVLLKYAMKIDDQYHWTFQEISKIYGIIKGLCYLGRCQNSRLHCPWQPLGNLRPRPADILPGTEVTGGHLKIWSKPGKIP